MVKATITIVYGEGNRPIEWIIRALEDLIVNLESLQIKQGSDVTKDISLVNGPLALEAVITDERKVRS